MATILICEKPTAAKKIAAALSNGKYKTKKSKADVSYFEFKIKNKTWVNDLKMTMPGRTKLQSFLHRAKRPAVNTLF